MSIWRLDPTVPDGKEEDGKEGVPKTNDGNDDLQAPAGTGAAEEYDYQRTTHLGKFGRRRSVFRGPHAIEMSVVGTPLSPSPTGASCPRRVRQQRRSQKTCCQPGRLRQIYRYVVEDWIYLALLGILMAACSIAMDVAIEELQMLHVKIYDWVENLERGTFLITYAVWVSYSVLLISGSALFAHYVAPQAIGSGIPEMKTIMRGVTLKEYLTPRTLISKMVGLTLSLGSGLPIGKEGPFVHVASVVASMLSKLVHGVEGVYENESRRAEMLAAACAVGVACTFSAPVGGVLFSIEVTAVFFAVRNYWRAFFASVCAGTVFRVLRTFLVPSEVTVRAFFQTSFPNDCLLPEELPIFALIGLFCGLCGALFIALHRRLVLFLRRNTFFKTVFAKYWVLYTMLASFLISSLTYPKGFGMFLAGERKLSQALQDFFLNCSWTAPANHSMACDPDVVDLWTAHSSHSIFVTLPIFFVSFFLLALLASTIPIPAGIFMPIFVIGAAFGRLVGECVFLWWPEGLRGADSMVFVQPGIYSIVGAAAIGGALTHTVSIAVIVFELTGQLLYILPVMVAVLVANATCSNLQPSIYDSIIKIKHLPYLPDIPHSSSVFHRIRVDQFMQSHVVFLHKMSTYRDLQQCLLSMGRVKAFPLVENAESRVLLGSIGRANLHRLLYDKIGPHVRMAEARRRLTEVLKKVDLVVRSPLSPGGATGGGTSALSASSASSTGNNGMTAGNGNNRLLSSISTSAAGKRRFTVVPVPSVALGGEARNAAVDDLELTRRRFADAERDKLLMNLGNGNGGGGGQRSDLYHTIGGMLRSVSRAMGAGTSDGGAGTFGADRWGGPSLNGGGGGGIDLLADQFDLSGEERVRWEEARLSETLDFARLPIDPAPFQLVEHTSLFKVHSLFSLLGLNRAYVTHCGRLVGVVALRELRSAIQRAQGGLLLPDDEVDESEDDETSTASKDALDVEKGGEKGEPNGNSLLQERDDDEEDDDDDDSEDDDEDKGELKKRNNPLEAPLEVERPEQERLPEDDDLRRFLAERGELRRSARSNAPSSSSSGSRRRHHHRQEQKTDRRPLLLDATVEKGETGEEEDDDDEKANAEKKKTTTTANTDDRGTD